MSERNLTAPGESSPLSSEERIERIKYDIATYDEYQAAKENTYPNSAVEDTRWILEQLQQLQAKLDAMEESESELSRLSMWWCRRNSEAAPETQADVDRLLVDSIIEQIATLEAAVKDKDKRIEELEHEATRQSFARGNVGIHQAEERRDLEAQLASAREELEKAQSNNHARNVELDSLHFVWCDGGCGGGVHRFGKHPELTAEIVASAERNARRLRRWYVNHSGRTEPPVYDQRVPTWMAAEREVHEKYVTQTQTEIQDLESSLQRMTQALTLCQQAFIEIDVSRKDPRWFTKGENAAWQHAGEWIRKGADAVKAALTTSPDTQTQPTQAEQNGGQCDKCGTFLPPPTEWDVKEKL